MTFLIFVAAFVVVACIVLPLGVVAVFAMAGDADTRVEAQPEEPRPKPLASDEGPLTARGGDDAPAGVFRRAPLVMRESAQPSGGGETVIS